MTDKHDTITTVKLSYSSFCALRPFYVTAPKPFDRKSCQCQYHEITTITFEVVRADGIVKASKMEDSFEIVCRSQISENLSVLLHPVSPQVDRCWLAEWVQDQTVEWVHYNTRLVTHNGTLEIIKLYDDKNSETTTHVCLVQNKSTGYRILIQNCNASTVVVFSEAWKCKYGSEVQLCHFGQNLPQPFLTLACTTQKKRKQDFVTESKLQDASAIWTHMEPVLRDPTVNSIHFCSDGPSKQYKRRINFCPLQCPSNTRFPENLEILATSHGKVAPDGIGGIVIRTAYSLVLQGNDIGAGKSSMRWLGEIFAVFSFIILLILVTLQTLQTYDPLVCPNHWNQNRQWEQSIRSHLTETRSIADPCHVSAVSHKCGSVSAQQHFSCLGTHMHVYRLKRMMTLGGKRGLLAMLVEEMDQEPQSGPYWTTTNLLVINCGDWLESLMTTVWPQ